MTPRKPGARRGRPKSPRAKAKFMTRLAPDVIAWARSTGNAAGAIDQAVRTSVEFRLWRAEADEIRIIAEHGK